MNSEEKIQSELASRFSYLAESIRMVRERRISVDVAEASFREVFDYAVGQMEFCVLCAITGLDEGETFGVIYHLAQNNSIVMNLKTSVPRDNPVLQTITDRFPAADAYERELKDLLGIEVEGLATDKPRYPLPDGWPEGQYPLRKDWNESMLGDLAPGKE